MMDGTCGMDKNFTNKAMETSSTDKTVEESDAARSLPHRRTQDSITAKNSARKMNLNRRGKNSERRGNGDPGYNGPHRRYTVDRRLTNKDRRKAV